MKDVNLGTRMMKQCPTCDTTVFFNEDQVQPYVDHLWHTGGWRVKLLSNPIVARLKCPACDSQIPIRGQKEVGSKEE